MGDNTAPKEESVCKDLWRFIQELVPHWADKITGGILAAVVAIVYALGVNIPHSIVWGLISLAFFAAAFRSWRKQCRRTDSVSDALTKEKKDREGDAIIAAKEIGKLQARLDDKAAVEKQKVQKRYLISTLTDSKTELKDREMEVRKMGPLAFFNYWQPTSSDDKSETLFQDLANYLTIHVGPHAAEEFASLDGMEHFHLQDIMGPTTYDREWQSSIWRLSHRRKTLGKIIEKLKPYEP